MSAVGIDFGNYYSCVAVEANGRAPEVVADAEGFWQLPSVVNFSNELKPRTGEESLKLLSRDPRGTIHDMKRMLGQGFSDLQSFKSEWSFPSADSKKGFVVTVKSEGRESQLRPHEVVAQLFTKLKETAESSVHSKTNRVTIAVPVETSVAAKTALTDAAKLAGFTQVSFLPDPIAAVLAYNLDQDDSTTRDVIVVDYGSKLSISLVSISNGLLQLKKHKATTITSDSIDKPLMVHFQSDFKRKSGLDMTESKRAVVRLKTEVTRVKTVLGQVTEAKVQLEGIHEGCDLVSSVTRARFEGMNSSTFSNMTSQLKEFLESTGSSPSHVILTGGNCKITKIQQVIAACFPEAKLANTLNPADVNAIGAAIQANLLEARGTQNLKEDKLQFSCLPLSIGLASHDGSFVPVLPKGTITPTKVTKQFGNATETQTEIFLAVYEGEDSQVANNRLLGQFTLSGLTPKPVGESIVTVEFIVDAKNALSIQATDGKTVTCFKLEGTKERQTVQQP